MVEMKVLSHQHVWVCITVHAGHSKVHFILYVRINWHAHCPYNGSPMQHACCMLVSTTCMLHAHEIHACCMLATYKIHVASIAVVYLGFLSTYVVPIKLLDWLTFLLSCCGHTGQRQFFILMIILYLPLVIIVSGLFVMCHVLEPISPAYMYVDSV